jgi:hypothetical protein
VKRELTEPPELENLEGEWSAKDHTKRAEGANAGSVTTRRLSDIEAKPVAWLWPGRIARGKLTIIAGNPGLGKSQITASIAAVVTQAGRWPVDRSPCTAGDVLFLSAEDDAADTLRPRLEAAGANLRRVHVVDGVTAGYAGDGSPTDRVFCLEHDVHALGEKLAELGDVAVVVIDPISAYLGNIDSHKNAEVRGLLAPLSDLASRHRTAIIGVSHLTKTAGTEALMRVSGSLAFVAAARAAYLVVADPQDKARRLFLGLKNNLAPDPLGLAFRVEVVAIPAGAGTLETSRIAWESESVTITADDVMQSLEARQELSALDEAVGWLAATLAEGPVASSEIFSRAKTEGIRERTLRRAGEKLGVKAAKGGMAGGWSWFLPPKVATPPEDVQVS